MRPSIGAGVDVVIEPGRRVGTVQLHQVVVAGDVVQGGEVVGADLDRVGGSQEVQPLGGDQLVDAVGGKRRRRQGHRTDIVAPDHEQVVGGNAGQQHRVAARAAE